MERPPTRTLAVLGSFALLVAVTVALAAPTAGAMITHAQVDGSGDGVVTGIDPADDPERLTVAVTVENPGLAAIWIRSAWVQVEDERVDGDSVVASAASLPGDRVTIPPGETRTVTVPVTIDVEDAEPVREAAAAGELTASGYLEGGVVDRGIRISITHA